MFKQSHWNIKTEIIISGFLTLPTKLIYIPFQLEQKNKIKIYIQEKLLLLLLSTKLQTPTDRAKCHKPEGTSREGSAKKEKINRNEGKKDKNTI